MEISSADVISMFMAAEMGVFEPSRSLLCGAAATEGGGSQPLVGVGTFGEVW